MHCPLRCPAPTKGVLCGGCKQRQRPAVSTGLSAVLSSVRGVLSVFMGPSTQRCGVLGASTGPSSPEMGGVGYSASR